MNSRQKNILVIYRKVLADIVSQGKMQLMMTIVLLVMSSISSYLLVEFIAYIITVATRISEENMAIADSSMRKIAIFLAAMFVTRLVGQYYSVYRIQYDKKLLNYVNEKLKGKLGRIKYEYFESHVIYEKLDRVDQKAMDGYKVVIESGLKILEILLYIIVYIVFLSKVNPIFAILITIAISFCGMSAAKMSKLKHQVFVDVTKMKQKSDYLNQISKDKIMHQEYQSGRLHDIISSRYREAYLEAQNGYLKTHIYTIAAQAKAMLFFCLTMFVSYLYLADRIMNGFTEAGIIISLMVIFNQLYGKTESLSYYISNRIEELLVVGEYFEILDYEESKEAKRADKAGSIEFHHVSYRYPQTDRKVLNELSIKIEEGEKVAIIGENGTGKTTFCNILLGLLTEYEGSIRIGGTVYTKQNPIPSQMIQSLSQDFNIYQMSIRDNILLSEGQEEKLEKVIDQAGIRELVNTFVHGSDTNIGQLEEKGVELSKGQEQRIATARLLVDDAPVWILDEPTAHLDPLAEIDAYRRIWKLSEQKTLLLVSHRLGFAPLADRIIVFDQGKVIEDGSHEELLKLNGIYAHMYEMQKSWYQSDKE